MAEARCVNSHAKDGAAVLLEALGAEIARAERTREPLTVVMAGIDHVIPEEEPSGPQQDDPLARTLKVIQGVLREDDVAARWGSHEYAIVLPGADRFAAAMVCQRVDGVVRAALQEAASVDVTMSFGLAQRKKPLGAGQLLVAAEADLASARDTAAHAA